MQRAILWLLLIAFFSLFTTSVFAGRKDQEQKEQEPKTEVLPLPKELPLTITADTARLSFGVSRLRTRGRMSNQIRDSLNEIIRNRRGARVVKLRAFVAGSGDSRRVQALVSELFTERRLPLPVLTVVEVGSVGHDVSQVVFEVVSEEKTSLNPHGLGFITGQREAGLKVSIHALRQQLASSGLRAEDVVSCTCYVSRLENYASAIAPLQTAFSKASVNILQAQRDSIGNASSCEAVARLSSQAEPAPRHEPAGVVQLRTSRSVLTGQQLAFGFTLEDARQAFSRLQRAVSAEGGEFGKAAAIHVFSISPEAASAFQKVVLEASHPAPPLKIQPVDGLPSLDAMLGIEAILAGSAQ